MEYKNNEKDVQWKDYEDFGEGNSENKNSEIRYLFELPSERKENIKNFSVQDRRKEYMERIEKGFQKYKEEKYNEILEKKNEKIIILFDAETLKYYEDKKINKHYGYVSRKNMFNKIMEKVSKKDRNFYKKNFKYVDLNIYDIISKLSKEGKLPKNSREQYLKRVLGITRNELPFEVKYNLHGLGNNKKIGFLEKICLKRVANKAEDIGIATVKQDVGFIKRIQERIKNNRDAKKIAMGIGATGLLLAGGIGIADDIKVDGKNGTLSNQTNITNEYEEKNNSSFKDTILVENTEFDELNKEKNDNTKSDNKEIPDYRINENEIYNNNLNDIKTGDVVHLDNGIEYYGNSTKLGKSYKIGDLQWRESGEYTIDGIAVVRKSENSEMELLDSSYGEFGIDSDEYINKIIKEKNLNRDDIDVMYHVNKGKDVHTDNNKYVGNNPTGWIDGSKNKELKIIEKYGDNGREER